MDKNIDFSNLNGYQSYDFPDPENFFNPMNQYEQGYMYYKCLCMQMDYKIKCKEYEKIIEKVDRNFCFLSTFSYLFYYIDNCIFFYFFLTNFVYS